MLIGVLHMDGLVLNGKVPATVHDVESGVFRELRRRSGARLATGRVIAGARDGQQ
jgi:hypothetical protein